MNLRGFDLNLLIALDALLSERSVTRAAERLNITQPAMSNALQRMRLRFDDQILERQGRELRLTPVAEELVKPVRDLLSSAEALLGYGDAFDPATSSRTFRISMSDYCAMVLLPSVIERFSKAAPFARCEVEALNDRSVDRVRARLLDFCVSAQDLLLFGGGVPLDQTKVSRGILFRDVFISAAATDHPALAGGMTPEQYLSYPHVSYRSGLGTQSLDDHAKQTAGLDVAVAVVTPTLSSMPLVLKGTSYISTIPSRLIESIQQDHFRTFPCPIKLPELVETLYWHPLSDTDVGHAWMRELLFEAARELGEPPEVH